MTSIPFSTIRWTLVWVLSITTIFICDAYLDLALVLALVALGLVVYDRFFVLRWGFYLRIHRRM